VNQDHVLVNWGMYKSVITEKFNVVDCKLLNAISVRKIYSVATSLRYLFARSTSIWYFKMLLNFQI
jgi:hypothetical protein